MLLVAVLFGTLAAVLASSVLVTARGARELRAEPRDEQRRALVAAAVIALITVVAAWLRLTHAPAHHVMYVDEPWYIEAARSILARGRALLCEQTWGAPRCRPYPKSLGWPVMLTAPFATLGASDLVAIRTATALGALAAPLAASVARLAGARWLHAVIAALLVATSPAHLAWSTTAETNVPGATVLLLAVAGVLAFARWRTSDAAVLGASSLVLASAVRPEAVVGFVPVLALFAPASGRSAGWLRHAAVFAVGGMLAIAAATPMWSINREISGGAFLALGNVTTNLRAIARLTNGPYYAALLAVAIVGAIGLARERRHRELVVLGATAVLNAAVVLLYDRIAERMLIGPAVCLLPLAALSGTVFSVERRRALSTVGAIVTAAIVTLPAWRVISSPAHVPETQLLETRLPALTADAARAPDALVVTEWPTIVASAGVQAMSTRESLRRGDAHLAEVARQRSVYFVCDMFCEQGFGGPGNPSSCPGILQRFALEPVATTSLSRRLYGVYRVLGPAQPGTTRPQCPRGHPHLTPAAAR